MEIEMSLVRMEDHPVGTRLLMTQNGKLIESEIVEWSPSGRHACFKIGENNTWYDPSKVKLFSVEILSKPKRNLNADCISVEGRMVRCVSSKNESIYKPGEIYRVFKAYIGDHYCIQSESSKMNNSFPLSGIIVSQAVEMAEFEILN